MQRWKAVAKTHQATNGIAAAGVAGSYAAPAGSAVASIRRGPTTLWAWAAEHFTRTRIPR